MRRSRATVLVGTAAVVLATATAPAGGSDGQGDVDRAGRYVVLLAADPVSSYDGGLPGMRATSPRPGRQLDPDSPAVEQYAGYLRRQRVRAIQRAGVEGADITGRYSFVLNGFSAELTGGEAQALERQGRVAAVMRDRLRPLLTDNSPTFLGLDGQAGPWESDILGEDVVVGVVDTGIWPEHPSFADDGTFGPLPEAPDLPCEFGTTPGNPDDAAFACNDKLLGARDVRITYKQVIGPETYDSARDPEGHGTHTASTVAGNREVDATIFGIGRGRVSGIAPRARLVAYRACGEQGCFSSDTAAAVEQAVVDGVDVINFSIGGGAALVTPDSIAFLGAADAGVFVATSAGNGGPGPGTVSAPSVVPWVTSVGASTQNRTFQGTLELGDGTQVTGASITDGTAEAPLVDAAAVGNELCFVDGFSPAAARQVAGAIVLCKRGENARVDKSLAVREAGGVGMVLYDLSDAVVLVTDNHWVPSVHITNSDGLAVKEFIAANGDTATGQLSAGEPAPARGSVMAEFSSRGPNPAAPDIIKPDITGPGVNILAGNTPTPATGAPGELFQSIGGTSMSAPHIAGVYALLKQEHPDWSPAMAKSAIMTTARQNVVEENRRTAADPFDLGAGHVRPGTTGPGSIFDPGLVYDAGTADYLAFLCGSDPTVFADPETTCSALEASGFSTDPRELNQPAIGVAELPGAETVTRTVTSVAGVAGPTTYTASVNAPAGFGVQVSPAELTLAPGETQRFTVSITKTGSAPLGQWRFGSLTWTGGGYRVRSPIAVAASAFDSPEVVDGAGREGTAAFGVRFGYTGAYDARPHGLVPQAVTAGSVAQDPDQTFDPADPTGTTAHRFRLAGTSYMRWELSHPNNAVDLDVYVFRRGRPVASSTRGGTDELVQLRLPRDGVYTLFVHGWQTVAEPRQRYTLRSWEVPRGTDGSLRLRAEPASAVLGRTGRVRVSWTGLRPSGRVHVGAVSHHRGAAALGLTVVRVTPRG
ncbi:MAG: S8 family serine peptidase [Actinomycetota bacterium]|nr:S8 family serine peptidase [Actinomycetota bacterium]